MPVTFTELGTAQLAFGPLKIFTNFALAPVGIELVSSLSISFSTNPCPVVKTTYSACEAVSTGLLHASSWFVEACKWQS
jgi:hypothetical protein